MTDNLRKGCGIMIRTNLDDFTDEEFDNIIVPYEENFKTLDLCQVLGHFFLHNF